MVNYKFTTLRRDYTLEVAYGWNQEYGWVRISVDDLCQILNLRREDWNHKLYRGSNVSEWHYEGYLLPLDTPSEGK